MLLRKFSNENVEIRADIPDGKRILPPTPAEQRILWLLLAGGLASVGHLVFWFYTGTRPGYWPLYFLLLITVTFKLLRLLHEWYHYAAISAPVPPPVTRSWTVDMLTTYFAGEPYDMVIDTLKAMQAVTYPHTTYLCDESNDPYLKQVCAELGVVHVYRGPEKPDAKAGNINYALRNHAKGEICVILDPDHRPRPDFLDRTLPYFEEEKVGFVQCIQAYGNQADSLIAKAAAEHTYHFYGPMMMSMNTYGTVQAIGANCTFRRAALDEIGGHAAGLSEDMHTAMRLHSFGWKSVYVPENLSRGLVPETLSAFYKQQLKWSRGTFDLLFYKFPKLVQGLTWRQILHYLSIPLYFLTGLIAAIDMILPIWALLIARVPLHTDMLPLFQAVALVLFFLGLNRLYVQKWTLDRREKGLHFWGGVLLLNSWWVYLVGFIYAIFRIKVPYIPTPKGDVIKNEWLISIPNLVMMGLGLGAIAYGLYLDWSPYTWFMASLVGTNILMLGLGVLIAQRKSTQKLYNELLTGRWSRWRLRWADFRYDVLFQLLRAKKVVGFLTMAAWGIFGLHLAGVWSSYPGPGEIAANERGRIRDYAGLKWGTPLFEAPNGSTVPSQHLAVIDLPWGELASASQIPPSTVLDWGYVPYVRWDWERGQPSWHDLLAGLPAGRYDRWLDSLAYDFAKLGYGLYLAPIGPVEEPDFVVAWRYVYDFFAARGVENLTWVWPMEAALDSSLTKPPMRVVRSLASAGPHLLHQQVEASAKEYPAWRACPVFLTGLKADSFAIAGWELLREWPIEGVLATDLPGSGELETLADAMGQPVAPFAHPYVASIARQPELIWPVHQIEHTQRGLSRGPHGKYRWTVDQAPFYLRGVAYTSGHSWRDDQTPLVREVLAQDFAQIREMGGNTIRRYGPSVYDYNLLKEAKAHNLKVLYGFPFDPRIDFLRDSSAIANVRQEVLDRVRRWKDAPAILAWVLGDGTWEHQAHYATPLYLRHQRQAYLALIEDLAQEIHRIDGSRPVAIVLEHGANLGQALTDLGVYVPSIDLIGINATFQRPIAEIDRIYQAHHPGRPYFLAQFGPQVIDAEGRLRLTPQQRLAEPSDLEKAQAYYQQWQEEIAPQRGHNLGGVAFSWRDRLDITRTWSGITDTRFRQKFSYYALQRAWRSDSVALPIQLSDLRLEVRPFGNREFEVRAVVPRSVIKGHTFTWELVNEDFLYEKGSLLPYLYGESRSVWVKTPQAALPDKRYRIVLYVDDGEGHVITASHPIEAWPSSYSSNP